MLMGECRFYGYNWGKLSVNANDVVPFLFEPLGLIGTVTYRLIMFDKYCISYCRIIKGIVTKQDIPEYYNQDEVARA